MGGQQLSAGCQQEGERIPLDRTAGHPVWSLRSTKFDGGCGVFLRLRRIPRKTQGSCSGSGIAARICHQAPSQSPPAAVLCSQRSQPGSRSHWPSRPLKIRQAKFRRCGHLFSCSRSRRRAGTALSIRPLPPDLRILQRTVPLFSWYSAGNILAEACAPGSSVAARPQVDEFP